MDKLKPMHPRRITIMKAIMEQPNITYRDLSERLGGVSIAIVMHHVKILKEKGLLRDRREKGGRNNFEVCGFSNPPMEPYYKVPEIKSPREQALEKEVERLQMALCHLQDKINEALETTQDDSEDAA